MASAILYPVYEQVRDTIRGLGLSGYESDRIVARKKLTPQGLVTPCIVVAPGPLSLETANNDQYMYRVGVVIAVVRAGGEQDLDLGESIDQEAGDLETIIAAFQDERINGPIVKSEPCSFDALDPLTDQAYRQAMDGQYLLLRVPVRYTRQ